MKVARLIAAVAASALLLSACSGSDESDADTASSSATGGPQTIDESANAAAAVVAAEGSVVDVLASTDDVSNFSDGVQAWLEANPGDESVLPNNDAFTEDDVASAGEDADSEDADEEETDGAKPLRR